MRLRLRLAAVAATAVACAGLGLTGISSASAAKGIAGFALAHYMGNGNTAMCMTAGGNNLDPATVEPCDAAKWGSAQAWHWLDPFGGGYSQLANGYGKCLGVIAGSVKQGTHLDAYTCKTGHLDQYWLLDTQFSCSHGTLSTFYPILNEGSSYVVGVVGGEMGNGQPLAIWHYQFTCNNQFWGGAED